MSVITNQTTLTEAPPTASVRAGLALSAAIGLANLPFLSPDIDWGAEAPPYGLLILAAAIGMVSVACAAIAWPNGNRRALRINAAALIVNAVMVLPGLFGDTPAFINIAAALFVVTTVVAVVLTMRRSNKRTTVVD
ncbi:MAG: hypothetical protein ACR2OH_05570 [Microthrixaceae bacterium]